MPLPRAALGTVRPRLAAVERLIRLLLLRVLGIFRLQRIFNIVFTFLVNSPLDFIEQLEYTF